MSNDHSSPRRRPTRPTVSVAMATFNGSRYVQAQLDSIGNGTMLPDEMMICDDGSRDNTVDIIRRFAAQAPFPVKLEIHEENQGTLSAFANAIGRCSGDIIVLSDQDDLWYPDRIDRLVDAFARLPEAQLVFSDTDLIGPRNNPLGTFWPMIGINDHHVDQMRTAPFGLLVARPMVAGCAMAMRADFARIVLPMPDIRFGRFGPLVHDRWLSMALSALGPYGVIREPLLAYRLHAEQQIGVPSRRLRRLIPPPLRQWRQVLVPRSVQRQRLEVDRLYLVELKRRLDEAGIDPPEWADIADAVAHLRVRVGLPDQRALRARAVLAEWRTGRYQTYALGSASAVGDLIRR